MTKQEPTLREAEGELQRLEMAGDYGSPEYRQAQRVYRLVADRVILEQARRARRKANKAGGE